MRFYNPLNSRLHTSTTSEHDKHVCSVLERFRECGLVINPEKCEFVCKQVRFLGHTIDQQGIRPLEQKVKVVAEFPKPEKGNQLRRFLNTINYYKRFIPNASNIQLPLLALIKGNKKNDQTPIKLSQEAEDAFERCKESLVKATLLAHPERDAVLTLMVDASDSAIGAALHQVVEEQSQPLAFFSQKLDRTQMR